MGARLWQHSERDLKAAERLVYPDTYYAAAYHAHQAAEKALKAAHWYLRGEEPPWTHDLMKCAARVAESAGQLPPAIRTATARLQPMFDVSRYPSGDVDEPIPPELVGEQDANSAISSAKEVRAWVESLVRLPPGRAGRTTTS